MSDATTSGGPIVTRVVSCFRQWDFVRLWIDDERLYEPHVRWIIVNDDPVDKCPGDLGSAFARHGVELRIPSFNRGISGSRNFGLSAVTTPWVEFVDGDDWPLPLREAPLLESAGKAFLIYSFTLHTIEGGALHPIKEWPFNDANTDDIRFIFERDPRIDCRAAVALWDRRALLDLGGFDSRFDGVEDLHLAWKLDRLGLPFGFVQEAKQSYYWCNPAQSAVEWRKQGQLRFFQLARATCSQDKWPMLDRISAKYAASMTNVGLNAIDKTGRDGSQVPEVREAISNELRALFWRTRKMLRDSAHGMPLSFRLKEAVKMALGRF